jgi:hypothetical protein
MKKSRTKSMKPRLKKTLTSKMPTADDIDREFIGFEELDAAAPIQRTRQYLLLLSRQGKFPTVVRFENRRSPPMWRRVEVAAHIRALYWKDAPRLVETFEQKVLRPRMAKA